MADATYSFAIVCEDEPDRRAACGLADRVLREAVSWFEGIEESTRQWRGEKQDQTFLKWAGVLDRAREKRLPIRGHLGGEPGVQDAGTVRAALWLMSASTPPPDVVVIVRDEDGHPERLKGIQQACESQKWPFKIVIGIARHEHESWLLAGFEPRDEERTQLEVLRRELGFDPCLRPQALTAKHDHDRKSAKRVFWTLSRRDPDREAACWRDTSLATLRERGAANGLADYLGEIEAKLVPIVKGG